MTPEQQQAIAIASARMRMAQGNQTAPQSFLGRMGSNAISAGKAIYNDPKGALYTAAQGPTFGFSDEIVAGLSPLKGKTYSEGLQELREPVKRFTEQNPWTALGLQVAPAVLSGKAAVSGIEQAGESIAPKTTSALAQWAAQNPEIARTLNLSAIGGVSAGAYATGTGEGPLSERLQEAEVPAAIGAVAGPAVGVGLNALAKVGDSALTKFAAKFDRKIINQTSKVYEPADRGFSKVVERLRKDYPDQKDFNAALQEYEQGGALAEIAGKNTTNLAKGAAQYPGAVEKTGNYIENEISAIPQKISKASSNITSNDNYYKSLDSVVSKGRARAAPLYERAYQKTVESDVLAKPEIRDAIKKAKKLYPSELKDVPDNSVKALDYAKRVLDDDISSAQRTGNSNFARDRSSLKNSLLSEIDTQVPEYKAARSVSGDYLSNKNAMESGQDIFKADTPTIKKSFEKLGDTEKESYKIGVRKNIEDQIRGPDGNNLYKKIFGSQEKRDNLRAIMGPNEYRDFQKEMDAVKKLYGFRYEVLGNSATVSKGMAAADIANNAMGDLAESIVTGGIQSIPRRTIGSAIVKMTDGISDKTAARIADVLYETDPQKKLAILRQIKNSSGIQKSEGQKAIQTYFDLNDKIREIDPDLIGISTGVISGKQGD